MPNNFNDEMSRFLPADIQEQTLQKEKFKIFLGNEITELLETVREQLL